MMDPQRKEEMIQQVPGIVKCGVIVQEDAETGHVPVVFISVEAKESKAKIKETVANAIVEDLPAYYKPEAIIVLDQMPVNNNQKIDYHALEREAQKAMEG